MPADSGLAELIDSAAEQHNRTHLRVSLYILAGRRAPADSLVSRASRAPPSEKPRCQQEHRADLRRKRSHERKDAGDQTVVQRRKEAAGQDVERHEGKGDAVQSQPMD